MFLSSPQYILQNLTIDSLGSTIDEIMDETRRVPSNSLGVDLDVSGFLPEIRLPHHVSSEEIAEKTGGVLGKKLIYPDRVTDIFYPDINGRLFTGHFGDEERNRRPAAPSFTQRDKLGSLTVDINLRQTGMVLLEDQVLYVREFETQGENKDMFVSVFTLGKNIGFSHVSVRRDLVTDENILRAADMANAAYRYRK